MASDQRSDAEELRELFGSEGSSDSPESTEEGREDPDPTNIVGTDFDLEEGDSSEDAVAADIEDGLQEDDRGHSEMDDLPESIVNEYIRIYPVRAEIEPNLAVEAVQALHEPEALPPNPIRRILGDQQRTYEFLIVKPQNQDNFRFYIGLRHDDDIDTLDATVRSNYPEEFEFQQESVNLSKIFDETPHMTRWVAAQERNNDWMMPIARFDHGNVDRSPLSQLLESVINVDEAFVCQVVFEAKDDWRKYAESHKVRLREGNYSEWGRASMLALDMIMQPSKEEKKRRYRSDTPGEVGDTAGDTESRESLSNAGRLQKIDYVASHAISNSFDVSIRAASGSEDVARRIKSAFNRISGDEYMIQGEYMADGGLFGEDNEVGWERLLKGKVVPRSPAQFARDHLPFTNRTKRHFVFSPNELANFITVPSVSEMPKAARGGSGGKPAARSPLTAMDMEQFREYDSGVCFGQIVSPSTDTTRAEAGPNPDRITPDDEWGNAVESETAVKISPENLKRHTLISGGTGTGKSVTMTNCALTARQETSGPTILIDPKGDGLPANYLRAHYELFGSLDDCHYIRVPENNGEIPGMPFFDLRPLIAGGMDREVAIDRIATHYKELLRFVLGEKTMEQAMVGVPVLVSIMKTMFDGEYGMDAFGISDLYMHALAYQKCGYIRKTTDHEARSFLETIRARDPESFRATADAAINRVIKLKEYEYIWRSLDFVGKWDAERNWFAEDQSMLDLRSVMDSDDVFIIDLGELRNEAVTTYSYLFLTQIWTAATTSDPTEFDPADEVNDIDRRKRDDYVANVVIDEAAPIVRSKIVKDDLLPEGRSFDTSLTLVTQFPGQVQGDKSEEFQQAYKELITNTNTKLIGNIASDENLPDSLFHDKHDAEELRERIKGLPRGEYIGAFPSPKFGDHPPEVVTIRPLPLPPGHEESDIDSALDREDLVNQRNESREQFYVSIDRTSNAVEEWPDITTEGLDPDALRQTLHESDLRPDPSIWYREDGVDHSSSVGEEPASIESETEAASTESTSGSGRVSTSESSSDDGGWDGFGDEAVDDVYSSTEPPTSAVSVDPSPRDIPEPFEPHQWEFIEELFAIINREHPVYDLTYPTTELDVWKQVFGDNSFIQGGADPDFTVVDEDADEFRDLFKTIHLGSSKYTFYWPSQSLVRHVNLEIKRGPQVGDPGEGPIHRIAVDFVSKFLQDQVEKPDQEVKYYETELDIDGTESNAIIDYVLTRSGDLDPVVVEVETVSGSHDHISRDAEKLERCKGVPIWVVPNRDAAYTLTDILDERLDESVISDVPTRKYPEQVDGKCMDQLHTLTNIVDYVLEGQEYSIPDF